MSAVLALLASVLWGTSDFLGGTASRRAPVTSVLGLSQLTALVALVPVALVTGALGNHRAYVVPSVAAGLVGVGALGCFYRALATGTMSVVAPVAALGVVVPVAVGLASGESPHPVHLPASPWRPPGSCWRAAPSYAAGRGWCRSPWPWWPRSASGRCSCSSPAARRAAW